MTRLRRLLGPLSLRAKLVVALVVLVAVGLGASGVAAAAALRGYLVGRVDDQLRQVSQPIGRGVFGPPPGDPDHGAGLDRGAHGPSQFYSATLGSDGSILSVHSTPYDVDSLPGLGGLSAARVAATSGHPFTLSGQSGGGQWRAIAIAVGGGDSLVVAQSLGDVQHTVGRLEELELGIGAIVLLVLVIAGSAVVRRSLRPLVQVEQTAASIAAGDLSQRVPAADPRTEVGRLNAALNGMLGQIERAFDEQRASETSARRSEDRMRRFVADASHELRTPLTSIRGFAELFGQGALSDPNELDTALRRIEDEAGRMGVLVDDLLLLARLDQQRPLQRQPVDVLALARDAVEDAEAVEPERAVSLEYDADSAPIVVGDELRLRQVLGNLVGNALQHTPAATPVTVRVRTTADDDGEWVVLEVIDEGPGLSPSQAEHVFERFYRADDARTRSAGGTGLGLSIVDGLARAHGGRIELDTAPGEGSTFRVTLPRPRGM